MLASLPIAAAIALSPFAIIPAIVILLTPRPHASAGAFLTGWALGITLVAGSAVATADLIALWTPSPRLAVIVRWVLGGLLVLAGLLRWMQRRQDDSAPAWLKGVQTATPGRALVLGLALSIANPKVLLLALAGGVVIATSNSGAAQELLGVLAFTAIASLSVALPWLALLLADKRALPLLERLRVWLEANARAIMAIVFIVLGAVLIAAGFNRLPGGMS